VTIRLVSSVKIRICLFHLVSFVTIRLFYLVSSVTQSVCSISYSEFFCVLLFVVSSSEDSVVLCGSLLSYSELFCVLFCSFIMFHLLHEFLSFDRHTLLLFEDSTSCNSKLKVSSYCTLSLRGDVRDIYWARPKPRINCNRSKLL
jgi:hypothetical protein